MISLGFLSLIRIKIKIVLELKEELEKDNDFNVFVDDLFWGITLKDVKEVILEVFKDKISKQELERWLDFIFLSPLRKIISQCHAYVFIKTNNSSYNNKIKSKWIAYELETIKEQLPKLNISLESKDSKSVFLYDSELDKLKTYYNLQDLKKALKDLITPFNDGYQETTLLECQPNYKLFMAYKPNCTKE
ncbi:hypothetical protein [Helicobacter cetorum]|uniref:hypothetical protein n=1 Tax=Helicobacter cetorum TaxID=138563 RepID=UPI001F1A981A|nr:hypothetical protein [Helicobacter cetorum]